MSDYLIYFVVGSNIDYFRLLEMSMNSLYSHGKYSGDIVILLPIDKSFDNHMPQTKFNKERIFFDYFNGTSLMGTASSKFCIYQKEYLKRYEKIIYIDTDTLFINSVDSLFDSIGEKIEVTNDNLNYYMDNEFWGGDLFIESEIAKIRYEKIFGVNAGYFGFRPNSKNLHILKYAHDMMMSNKYSVNACLDQPFFNCSLFRNGNFGNETQNYILHNNNFCLKNTTLNQIENYIKNKFIVLHFCGGPGNCRIKYKMMSNIYNIIGG